MTNILAQPQRMKSHWIHSNILTYPPYVFYVCLAMINVYLVGLATGDNACCMRTGLAKANTMSMTISIHII